MLIVAITVGLLRAPTPGLSNGGCVCVLLTLDLLLRHDGVAQRQQTEEGLGRGVPLPHQLHQAVVVEHKLGVGQVVPGEVHLLGFL